LGGIETQSIYTPAFELSRGGDSGNPAHHIRFENLKAIPVSASATEADSIYPGGFISTIYSGAAPKYIILDRIYTNTPNDYTRVNGLGLAGSQLAIVNSYLRAEYWRPHTFHYGPDISTTQYPDNTTTTFTLHGFQWRKRATDALRTQADNTIVSVSGTASATTLIVGVMDTTQNGVKVLYTSGTGVTVTCPTCRAVVGQTGLSNAYSGVGSTEKTIFYMTVANGASVLSAVNLAGDSFYSTEGPDLIIFPDADHILIRNNYLEGYGKGMFVDVPSDYYIRTPPSHITIQRNNFFWNQDHRITSGTSNGFNYGVRHCGGEFRRTSLDES
jgi:hypothetical protein